MACSHCEELREEIRFLKRERELEQARDKVTCLKMHFGIPSAEAQMLSGLYFSKGRVLSDVQIDEMVPAPNAGDERELQHVKVRIHRLRKKLGAMAIETVWGRGYFLTELGRLQVEEALEGRRSLVA